MEKGIVKSKQGVYAGERWQKKTNKGTKLVVGNNQNVLGSILDVRDAGALSASGSTCFGTDTSRMDNHLFQCG